jgi:hypothetical protein
MAQQELVSLATITLYKLLNPAMKYQDKASNSLLHCSGLQHFAQHHK